MTPTIRIIDIAGKKQGHRFEPYQRMANAIIERALNNGGCTEQDLLAQGFTKQETRDLWHMSHAMASIELKLMSGEAARKIKSEAQYA